MREQSVVASPDQFDYDIFISYAHVDDAPLTAGSTGWVSALARGLRNLLARKLGRQEDCRIWFASGIMPVADLMEWRSRALDVVARSKLLLAVVSPAYVASDLCAGELRAFTSRHAQQGRIVPVWLHPMPPEDVPDALRGLAGCKMWGEDDDHRVRTYGMPEARPEDREYWRALNDLADTIFSAMRDVQVRPRAADPPAQRLPHVSLAEPPPASPPKVEPKHAATARDVFISYSSKDKPIADATCAMLEQNGIRCWIAPRDILPGKTWAGSIIEAINVSRLMVLVFSGHCNTSPQIEREVERAINRGIPIIPMRIEDVQPTDSLSYYISTPHWLDAFSPPLEQHLLRLVEVVRVFNAKPD
jgi:hypothetical protein